MFSADEEKKRFGKEIFQLIRTKEVAASEAISLVLMLEGINQHLTKETEQREHFYEVGETLKLS
jgi:hypothetical protein